MYMHRAFIRGLAIAIPALAFTTIYAQDRLPKVAGFAKYQQAASGQRERLLGDGVVYAKWKPDGSGFTFMRVTRKSWTYDLATKTRKPTTDKDVEPFDDLTPRGGTGPHGQFESVTSSDGKLIAKGQNRNVSLTADGQTEQITKDGSKESRIRYGSIPWVYAEELAQMDSTWFSPDSRKLAYYGFDESKVNDYYVTIDNLNLQNSLKTEAFPLAGKPNPVADLYVYDIKEKRTVKIDAHSDTQAGEYLYDVSWAPNGELLFFRMNRVQNQQELVAADPSTGKCRVIFHRSHPNGWIEPLTTGDGPVVSRQIVWVPKSTKFLFVNDDSGFRNLDLYDLKSGLIRHVTQHKFDVRYVKAIDLKHQMVWYTSEGRQNPYLTQLHKIHLDGNGDECLTDERTAHQVKISPAGNGFLDMATSYDMPPRTTVCDANGKVLDVLAECDLEKIKKTGAKLVERFTFKAADGKTDVYGYLMKPSNFDPKKKYPLLISTYAGPNDGTDMEKFLFPDPITELGYVTAWIDSRGSGWRGRAFKEVVLHHLGGPEVDDQAAGARSLAQRAYIDPKRIGIYGTSYGGYTSLMAILRYPDVFHAASASSPAVDWHDYDTIYTERYMGLPSEQVEAYKTTSLLPYAKNLKGHVLLYFGTSDDNVHPAQMFKFVHALDEAGKSYEMAIGPDEGHSAVNALRMMEFFIDHLGQAR